LYCLLCLQLYFHLLEGQQKEYAFIGGFRTKSRFAEDDPRNPGFSRNNRNTNSSVLDSNKDVEDSSGVDLNNNEEVDSLGNTYRTKSRFPEDDPRNPGNVGTSKVKTSGSVWSRPTTSSFGRGRGTSSSVGGRRTSSSVGGRRTSSSVGGRRTSSSVGGRKTSSSFGGRRTSGGRSNSNLGGVRRTSSFGDSQRTSLSKFYFANLNMTLLDVLENNAEFSTFWALARLERGGVEEALKSKGPFTIFMPTNLALSIFLGNTLVRDVKEQNARDIVLRHIINGRVLREDIPQGRTNFITLGSEEIGINKPDDYMVDITSKQGKASIKTFNIKSKNGIIHIIDSVL